MPQSLLHPGLHEAAGWFMVVASLSHAGLGMRVATRSTHSSPMAAHPLWPTLPLLPPCLPSPCWCTCMCQFTYYPPPLPAHPLYPPLSFVPVLPPPPPGSFCTCRRCPYAHPPMLVYALGLIPHPCAPCLPSLPLPCHQVTCCWCLRVPPPTPCTTPAPWRGPSPPPLLLLLLLLQLLLLLSRWPPSEATP